MVFLQLKNGINFNKVKKKRGGENFFSPSPSSPSRPLNKNRKICPIIKLHKKRFLLFFIKKKKKSKQICGFVKILAILRKQKLKKKNKKHNYLFLFLFSILLKFLGIFQLNSTKKKKNWALKKILLFVNELGMTAPEKKIVKIQVPIPFIHLLVYLL